MISSLREDNESLTVRLNLEIPLLLSAEALQTVTLESPSEQILLGSWVVIARDKELDYARVKEAQTISQAAYGLTGKATSLTLNTPWLKPADRSLAALRKATVYAQSDPLELAEEPVDEDVAGDVLELNNLIPALKSGRWLIVSGERTDIPGTRGVKAAELVMLAGVVQGVRQVEGTARVLPGDRLHTFLQLARPLEYSYKRDTVTIYGNVVKATHGQLQGEVLGSGDGSQELQSFALKQPPLTFVAANDPSGVTSTLEVRVNDVHWHERASLPALLPAERGFFTKTDDNNVTTIIFGNGQQGARLPTGRENIRAVYRNGIGKGGNVKAEQISQLASRPPGVKEVINPLRASGGADRESRDQARKNVPLALQALDRLVSVQDYADFARTFAGIGKAVATRLTHGQQQLVHLTIAGADDIPIEKTSDLYRNLRAALRRFGDPYQPFQIAARELTLLVISAQVRLHPDYLWETVEAKIRAALLDAFSFERRELGQDARLSEVISVMQRIPGVVYVDVDLFDGIPEAVTRNITELKTTMERLTKTQPPKSHVSASLASKDRSAGAELALLSPEIPDTLILNLLP